METVYAKEVHPSVVLRHVLGIQQRLLSTTTTDRDEGLQWTAPLNPSHPKAVPGPTGVPSRHAQVQRLMASSVDDPYDVLVIGGGATGAGIALDAVTRELDSNSNHANNPLKKIACIERGDFASETSSRSTKLIWAGIRYLATASATLLSKNLWHSPLATVQEFVGEMKMVLNCHRERRYMTSVQPHLTNWVPIAIPFSTWHVSPPPFGHWLFGFFPILAPAVLKLYDAMSSFTCPPSYVMGSARAKAVFPQLCDRVIKYCAVFYEAQHNDARTNIAIALTAAEHGAHISNYIEMIDVLRDSSDNNSQKVVGVRAVDRMTGIEFDIHAKQVVFAGGPFTDSLRQLEFQSEGNTEPTTTTNTSSNPVKEAIMKPAVNGASGTHLVLPGYYCPNNMGLLDYNTSDGRFLFFLPWEKHTLVGTTDTKCAAETLPKPPEDEVQWLLNECSKYLSPDLRVRRSDVLSAWRGWRPLAVDPHAPPGAPASRDHIISFNPESGVLFVAGGKWTTWREMAQDVRSPPFSPFHVILWNPLSTLLFTLFVSSYALPCSHELSGGRPHCGAQWSQMQNSHTPSPWS
jgi:glycerol-3-phosphate dehydrogenase